MTVAADLRANLGTVSSSSGGVLRASSTKLPTAPLSDVQQEQAALTVAIGRGEEADPNAYVAARVGPLIPPGSRRSPPPG